MSRLHTVVCLLSLLTALVVPASAQHTLLLEEEAIDYRQQVMRTMSHQVSLIEMILDGRAPADHFSMHVEVLALAAATAKWAFEFDVPGGNAEPAIWSNWGDFAQRMDALAAATDEVAKLAREGGVDAVRPRLQEALTCRNCHDNYRAASE